MRLSACKSLPKLDMTFLARSECQWKPEEVLHDTLWVSRWSAGGNHLVEWGCQRFCLIGWASYADSRDSERKGEIWAIAPLRCKQYYTMPRFHSPHLEPEAVLSRNVRLCSLSLSRTCVRECVCVFKRSYFSCWHCCILLVMMHISPFIKSKDSFTKEIKH